MKDYFSILGLNHTADEDEIRKGYVAMARKFHPDKNNQSDATEKFKEIGEAYEALKTEDKRIIYRAEYKREQQQQTTKTNSSTNVNTDCSSNKTASQTKHENRPTSSDSQKQSNFQEKYSSTFNFREQHQNGSKNDRHKPKKANQTNKDSQHSSKTKKSDKKPNDKKSSAKESRKPKTHFKFARQFTYMHPNWKKEESFPFTFSNPNDFDVFIDDPTVFESLFDLKFDLGDLGGLPRRHSSPFPAQRGTSPRSESAQSQRSHKSHKMRYKNTDQDDVNNIYDWRKPLFGPYWNRGNSGIDYYESDEDSDDGLLSQAYKCAYCYKLFSIGALQKHEERCGKFKPQTPPDIDYTSTPRRKSWREEHDDLIYNVRQAKKKMAEQTEFFTADTREPKLKGAFAFCQWCRKSYNKVLDQDHTTLCSVKTASGHKTAYEYSKNSRPNTSGRNTPSSRQGHYSGRTYMGAQFSATGTGLHSHESKPRQRNNFQENP